LQIAIGRGATRGARAGGPRRRVRRVSRLPLRIRIAGFRSRPEERDQEMSDDPTSPDDIKKDAKMMAAYLAYAKRRHILNEVKFYFNKGNAASLWPGYLDPDGSDPVNVSSKITKAGKMLADQNDFDNAAWSKIIASAKKEVAYTLTDELKDGFLASKEYKEYVAENRMGDPKKAAKLLGISDVKKLTDAMKAQATGDSKTAAKLFGEIAKKEKLKDDAKALMKALDSAGLV
jgi:hypothetical protein